MTLGLVVSSDMGKFLALLNCIKCITLDIKKYCFRVFKRHSKFAPACDTLLNKLHRRIHQQQRKWKRKVKEIEGVKKQFDSNENSVSTRLRVSRILLLHAYIDWLLGRTVVAVCWRVHIKLKIRLPRRKDEMNGSSELAAERCCKHELWGES